MPDFDLVPRQVPRVETRHRRIVTAIAVPESIPMLERLVPGWISGLYQLTVRLPPSLSAGDAPVVVRIGGLATPDGASIPVRR